MRRALAVAGWGFLAGLAALVSLRGAGIAAAQGERPVARDPLVEPAGAVIGVFYHGARFTVSTAADPGPPGSTPGAGPAAVAVVVSGPPVDLHLRIKRRVWGAFWAPAGDVIFERVPEAYVVHTSVPPAELAPADVLRSLGIGYESLRSPADSASEAGAFFPELVRLKESEKLFQAAVVPFRAERAAGGDRLVTDVVLPARAPAATYRVRVFRFRGGRVVWRGEGGFTISRGAANALLATLANRHGLLYGLVAVVVAVAAGLLVGFVFGSVKGH